MVNYESKVTWRQETNHLRCSRSFFGRERYDFILFKADENTLQFGRLHHVFIYETDDVQHPLAFIDAFGTVLDRTELDIDLGLCRLRVQRDSRHDYGTLFIHARSIIRGALIVEDDTEDDEDYLVIDTIDSDMFWRCRHHFPHWST